MSHNRRYHTVIFDVGGTLVGFEDDAPFAEFLATVDTPHPYASATELRLKMIRTLSIRRDEAVGIGLDDASINNWWLSIFLELFPQNPTTAQRMWMLFKDNYFDSNFPDTIPVLERLKAQGVPMGVISNYGTHLLDLLPKLELFDYFNFIIVSAIVEVTKPHPRIFEIAIEEAGVPADQILYVGDNYLDDIVGANNVGMDAVLINRPGRKPGTAAMVIDNLFDIEKLIYPKSYSENESEEQIVHVRQPSDYW